MEQPTPISPKSSLTIEQETAMPAHSTGKHFRRNRALESDSCTFDLSEYSASDTVSGYCTSPIKVEVLSCRARTQCSISSARSSASSEEDLFEMQLNAPLTASSDEAVRENVKSIASQHRHDDLFKSRETDRQAERSYISGTLFAVEESEVSHGTEISTTLKRPCMREFEVAKRKDYLESREPDGRLGADGMADHGMDSRREPRRNCFPNLLQSCYPRGQNDQAGCDFLNRRSCLDLSKSVSKAFQKRVSVNELKEMARKMDDVNEMKTLLDSINCNLEQLEAKRGVQAQLHSKLAPVYFTT